MQLLQPVVSLACLQPPLGRAPDDPWVCPRCRADGVTDAMAQLQGEPVLPPKAPTIFLSPAQRARQREARALHGREVWAEFWVETDQGKVRQAFKGTAEYLGPSAGQQCFEVTYSDNEKWRYTLAQLKRLPDKETDEYKLRQERRAKAAQLKAAAEDSGSDDEPARGGSRGRPAQRATAGTERGTTGGPATPTATRRSARQQRATAVAMMVMGITPQHLPRRWPLETVAGVEAVLDVLMPGTYSPDTLVAIWRAAALPWCMKHPRVTLQQVTYLLEVCNFSHTGVIWQPWTMGGAVEEALTAADLYLLGHIVNTRAYAPPRDMLLQPMMYAGMRNYHGTMDVCILTGPVDAMDIAIPLALCYVDQAVFAWVPRSYVDEAHPARQRFLRAMDETGRSVVAFGAAWDRTHVWLGLFTSRYAKSQIMLLRRDRA